MYYQEPPPPTVTNLIPRDNLILVGALNALHRELDVAISDLVRQAEAGQAKLMMLRAAKTALGDTSGYDDPVQTSAPAEPDDAGDDWCTTVDKALGVTPAFGKQIVEQARKVLAQATVTVRTVPKFKDTVKHAIRDEAGKPSIHQEGKVKGRMNPIIKAARQEAHKKKAKKVAAEHAAFTSPRLNEADDPRRDKKVPAVGSLGYKTLGHLVVGMCGGEFIPARYLAAHAGIPTHQIGNVIARLRKMGYVIEAAPKPAKGSPAKGTGGYRLKFAGRWTVRK